MMNQHGRGKAPYGIKQPMKTIRYGRESDEEEEEEEYGSEDPFNKKHAQLLVEEEKLEKKRDRTVDLLCFRFLKKWKTNMFSDVWIKFLDKMMHCMQKNIDVSKLFLMKRSDFNDFKENRITDEELTKIFGFGLKRGQRTATQDTLKTANIYGQLEFCDDVVRDQGIFQYPVTNDKIYIQIYVEGYEWEENEGFYDLLRFIHHYSGKRAANQDEDDDGVLADFNPYQIRMLRNKFLDILIEFLNLHTQNMNQYLIPQDNFVSGNFIAESLEQLKQK